MIGQVGDRVLLVDDEPLVRKFVSRCLVAEGYVVRVAVDGLDAIGKLRWGPPDVIISDLNMPRMSGVELLRVVRKRFPQIPVIVISGVDADKVPKDLAADAYCPKNEFLSEQLLQIVVDLTKKPLLRRAATPPIDVEDKPVQAISDKDGNYTITCGDCLRAFIVPRAPARTREENLITCVHCAKVVRILDSMRAEA